MYTSQMCKLTLTQGTVSGHETEIKTAGAKYS